MRLLLFALGGVALGYALHALSGARHSRGSTALLLVVRLVVFVVVVGWFARTHGPTAGLAALVAAIATRALLVRRSGLVERPDRGAEGR